MKPRILPTTAIRENRDGRHAWDGLTIESPKAGISWFPIVCLATIALTPFVLWAFAR